MRFRTAPMKLDCGTFLRGVTILLLMIATGVESKAYIRYLGGSKVARCWNNVQGCNRIIPLQKFALNSSSSEAGRCDMNKIRGNRLVGEDNKDRDHMVDAEIRWNSGIAQADGAQLTVMVPQQSTTRGIVIHVTLKNCGDKNFSCGENGYLPDCIVTMEDENGRKVQYSELGTSLFASESGGNHAQRLYKPQQSMAWEFDLASAFVKLEPGLYSVSLSLGTEIIRGDHQSELHVSGIQVHIR